MHMWAKHHIRSSIRHHIGNVSVCPVCNVDFWSRSRSIKHLADNRIRAKSRTVSCVDAFWRTNPPVIPADEYERLESIETIERKAARKGPRRLLKRPLRTAPGPVNNDERPGKAPRGSLQTAAKRPCREGVPGEAAGTRKTAKRRCVQPALSNSN